MFVFGCCWFVSTAGAQFWRELQVFQRTPPVLPLPGLRFMILVLYTDGGAMSRSNTVTSASCGAGGALGGVAGGGGIMASSCRFFTGSNVPFERQGNSLQGLKGESKWKPGIKMVYPDPRKELRRRPQLFMVGSVP